MGLLNSTKLEMNAFHFVIGLNSVVMWLMFMRLALVQLVKALRVVDADADKLRILYLELNESLSEADRNMTMLCHLGGKTTHCNPPNLTTGLPDLNQVSAFILHFLFLLHFPSFSIFSLHFVPLLITLL